jgi:DNA polymerase III epsilon subunit-like protein
MRARFVVFDLESTGFDRQKDRICSVAAIDLASGHEFYAECNPKRSISYGAQKAHGLSAKRLSKRSSWAVVGRRFWEWLRDHQRTGIPMILVGHNAVSFDIPMLANELSRLSGLEPAKCPMFVLDTLHICREVFPKTVLASKRQAKVYEHLFGSEPDDQHNALGDVKALVRIAASPIIRRRVEDPARALALELGGASGPWWPENVRFVAPPPKAPTTAAAPVITSKYFK